MEWRSVKSDPPQIEGNKRNILGFCSWYDCIGIVRLRGWKNSDRLIFVDGNKDDCNIILWCEITPPTKKQIMKETEEDEE